MVSPMLTIKTASKCVKRSSVALAALTAAAFTALTGGLILTVPGWTEVSRQKLAVSASPPVRAPAPIVPTPAGVLPLTRDRAVALNAAVPVSVLPNPAAKPFRLTAADELVEARSTGCLAAAVYYEAASEGEEGERAVAQVVLNRLRHPAFPKSVCSVVFQGADRLTGCQFTFTCDGSLRRVPSAAGWRRAEQIAKAALQGEVYKPVGHATHYHTNWVVPPWSASLDKVAIVGSHLFFRWTGGWGQPAAFRGRYDGIEPNVPLMASLSAAHQALGGQSPIATASASAAASRFRAISPAGDVIVAVLDGPAADMRFVSAALEACGSKEFCKFMAWTDRRSVPSGYPISPAQTRAQSFAYSRNRTTGYEKALWNCRQFTSREAEQCL